jgi:hypothetical protein
MDDGSAYGGRCPGMDSLGDCKQLQALERKKLMAIDVSIDPPVLAPQSLLGQLNRRPGKVTWVSGEQGEQVKPLLNVNYDVTRIAEEILRVEQRIEYAHYTQYFIATLGVTKQMTAEEARQRAEEKMMVLGPVIERFQYDLLEHILDRLVDAIMFHGLAPAPPEELQGNVKYTYSGPLALIQQMVELGNIQQWIALAAQMAAGMKGKEGILDRIDEDEVIEIAAKILAVDPALITSYEDAKKMREARAQQMQQMQQAEAMRGMAEGAATLSKAQVGRQNGLEAMLGLNESTQNSLGNA